MFVRGLNSSTAFAAPMSVPCAGAARPPMMKTRSSSSVATAKSRRAPKAASGSDARRRRRSFVVLIDAGELLELLDQRRVGRRAPLAPPMARNRRSSSISPRPPKTPRVFSSKSWFSSRTALQLRMRWSARFGLVEHAVERDRLPRPGVEHPGHVVGAPVRDGRRCSRPTIRSTSAPAGRGRCRTARRPRCAMASGVPGAGSARATAPVADDRGRGRVRDVDGRDRAADEVEDVGPRAGALMAMPRGALPGISPAGDVLQVDAHDLARPGDERRADRRDAVARRPSAARRGRSSGSTTQASEPSGRQAMATGFVRNSRGAGVVARLMPWFRFSGAVWRTRGAGLGRRDLGAGRRCRRRTRGPGPSS